MTQSKIPKRDPSQDMYTMKAPRAFYDLLAKTLIFRADGEVVVVEPKYDRSTGRVTLAFRKVGNDRPSWRVRLARWLVGVRVKET